MEDNRKEDNLFERTDTSNDFSSGPFTSAPEKEEVLDTSDDDLNDEELDQQSEDGDRLIDS